MKPQPFDVYDIIAMKKWVTIARPSAMWLLEMAARDCDNGHLGGLDLEQLLGDMAAHPMIYTEQGKSIDDARWLQSELGSDIAIHVWW